MASVHFRQRRRWSVVSIMKSDEGAISGKRVVRHTDRKSNMYVAEAKAIMWRPLLSYVPRHQKQAFAA